MDDFYPYHDKDFIINYRDIIERNLLIFYHEEVKKICKSLDIKENTYNQKQMKMTRKPISTALIKSYINALYNISGENTDIVVRSKFHTTASINMKETQIEDVPLYDFQKDAVSALKKHFITDDKSSGIMVMPTGSGKSRTSVSFLIKEMVSRGYQILWIAHRYMLID